MNANASYEQSAWFEHRFWLQILGDHARFIFGSLPRKEESEAGKAGQFIHVFDLLLEEARKDLSGNELMVLNRQANVYAQELRAFKLHLIKRHLTGTLEVPPTFLNHMVNEAEEYLRLLQFLLSGTAPPLLPPIHHHLLWLSDAAVHAEGISRSLDLVEQDIIAKSEQFTRHFHSFYLKAIELAGYLRSNVSHFPALSRFNHQVALEIFLFKRFLQELEELDLSEQLLGTLSPLLTDHMAREECYYLIKLAEGSGGKAPDCNPAHPRPGSIR
ncbi:DUF2935 domain-containing protein [Paenibacillus tyrfis]|uniref:DUF2935 domain-containing protein n=1 Tax=Paenibacillus tyrfis TaxID=1501230 RepID=UPI00209E8AEA|nr:DUF2935 domain-containing protein [Paenibacillus tyrfis]MCP1305746.1 DUF2935 domain-containing protein [Paenibacillus tyrfis]